MVMYELYRHTEVVNSINGSLSDETLAAAESVDWLQGFATAHSKCAWIWEEPSQDRWQTQQIKSIDIVTGKKLRVSYVIRPKQKTPPIDLSGTMSDSGDRLDFIADRHIITSDELEQAALLLAEAADLGLDWKNILISGIAVHTINSPASVIRESALYKAINLGAYQNVL